ncbi:inositol-pentakisphosphate 2-kinase isoform X2 [Condylostylus longicornis]|uniref:inositol-pentakisphosphate 2-kinase isoform X2 n=1 Tax=Condylostylus longicornis TaxID=2530218 RepID=UPI00244DA6DC|nr:inositol-pentakisphosphate 2-kinase isoform X2 [Condylostylus longicornis]
MDLLNTEIIYRAEGNANLVVNLPEHQKILRLQKTSTIKSSEEKNIHKNELDIYSRYEYMNLITKLLGSIYSCELGIIVLNESECIRLNNLCEPLRPINRIEKQIGNFGLLMSDATLISDLNLIQYIQLNNIILKNTLSIEIKPKQGFMIQDIQQDRIPHLFQFNGLNKCRYCCMQYSKLNQSKINEISKFCPMALFSGDFNKMIKTIEALLQNPQNNLRIFKNGLQCYGDYKDSMSLNELYKNIFESNEEFFKKLIVTCLLHPYKNETNAIENNIESSLPKGCVLHTLLSLQFLAKDNIEYMGQKQYEKEVSYKYLPDLLKKTTKNNLLNKLTSKEKYMIGATALDSSIMITFCEIANNLPEDILLDLQNIIKLDNRIFITQVKILDIDPKSDNHFQKYVIQTNKAYSETFSHLSKESNNS